MSIDIVGPDGKEIPVEGQFREYPEFKVPYIDIVGPRLLILPKPRQTYKTNVGIIIPEAAQEHTQEGMVLLTGDGILLENGERIPSRVEIGDSIIYARYAGVELELDGVKYMIIQESDVRAILTYKGKGFTLEPDPE